MGESINFYYLYDADEIVTSTPRVYVDYRLCGQSSYVNNDTTTDRDTSVSEDIVQLKQITYGIVLPVICFFGIIGNVLNLVVLTRPNMKGTAYVYMRGYSAAALVAILFAIPFTVRIRIHDIGHWRNYTQAFFHTYVELFIGNSFLGVGVMMLVALTTERYLAICHPSPHAHRTDTSHHAHLATMLIPLVTLLFYFPHVFRSEIATCLSDRDEIIYQKRDNTPFLKSTFYLVYIWMIEAVFKIGPTILLAYLNLRIVVTYKETCQRRRRMTGKVSGDDTRRFAEEHRLMLLLGSTSVLFLVCTTPMVILSIMITDAHLTSFAFQVFRAVANILEVTNYSITFYIYCLFSNEFLATFINVCYCKPICCVRGGKGQQDSGETHIL